MAGGRNGGHARTQQRGGTPQKHFQRHAALFPSLPALKMHLT
jgi:hypothetical protein